MKSVQINFSLLFLHRKLKDCKNSKRLKKWKEAKKIKLQYFIKIS